MEFNQTIAAAQAILGKDATFPAPRGDLDKAIDNVTKTNDEYKKAVEVLQQRILTSQTALSAIVLIMKQYQEQLHREDFGLDTSAAGVKDKIKKAQAKMDEFCNSFLKEYNKSIKDLDELDKHTMGLKSYKSPGR